MNDKIELNPGDLVVRTFYMHSGCSNYTEFGKVVRETKTGYRIQPVHKEKYEKVFNDVTGSKYKVRPAEPLVNDKKAFLLKKTGWYKDEKWELFKNGTGYYGEFNHSD